jgi:hypothetical protein
MGSDGAVRDPLRIRSTNTIVTATVPVVAEGEPPPGKLIGLRFARANDRCQARPPSPATVCPAAGVRAVRLPALVVDVHADVVDAFPICEADPERSPPAAGFQPN